MSPATRRRLRGALVATVIAVIGAAVAASLASRARDERESDEPAGLSSDASAAARPEERLLARPPRTAGTPAQAPKPLAPATEVPTAPALLRFDPRRPRVSKVALVDAATGLPLSREDDEAVRPLFRSAYLVSTERTQFAPTLSAAAGARWVSSDPDAPPIVLPTVPAATSMRADFPLRRAVEIRVRAEDAAGHPIPDAHVVAWAIGDRFFGRVDESAGVCELPRVPFFPGEPVWVHAAADPRQFPSAFAAKRVSGDEKLHASARVDLPETFQSSLDVVVTFDEEHVFGDEDVPYEESLGEGGAATGSVTLRVRVLRRDGTAAAHAALHVDGARPTSTGDDGVAVVTVPGDRDVEIHLVEPGLVPTTAVLDLRATESLDVVVQEPEPASLAVVVVFGDGRPAPYARLSFTTPSGVAPLDIVDGVVRVDPYVGADGRRTFSRVEPAQVTVRAVWGSRAASVVVGLRPGAKSEARVVLPDASRDAPRGFRNVE